MRRLQSSAGGGSRALDTGCHRPSPSTRQVYVGFSPETTRRTGLAGTVCDSSPLGKHPAGNCWLEGGRSLLLESAQEATLLSVAMVRFPRQSNSLAVERMLRDCAAKVVQVDGHSIEVNVEV
jgi:hypothetical protein